MVQILIWLTLASLCLAAPAKLDFTRDIRPILSDKCFSCHGPDEKKRMAGLRLDTKEGAFEDRKNGAVIVPGFVAKSKLVTRISHENKNLRMPPVSAGEPLSERQISLIKQWIEAGAPWAMHWAYEPPRHPVIPEVKAKALVRNPIDSLVLARLEKENLKFSPQADRATLLRRLTFDQIGRAHV